MQYRLYLTSQSIYKERLYGEVGGSCFQMNRCHQLQLRMYYLRIVSQNRRCLTIMLFYCEFDKQEQVVEAGTSQSGVQSERTITIVNAETESTGMSRKM